MRQICLISFTVSAFCLLICSPVLASNDVYLTDAIKNLQHALDTLPARILLPQTHALAAPRIAALRARTIARAGRLNLGVPGSVHRRDRAKEPRQFGINTR